MCVQSGLNIDCILVSLDIRYFIEHLMWTYPLAASCAYAVDLLRGYHGYQVVCDIC